MKRICNYLILLVVFVFSGISVLNASSVSFRTTSSASKVVVGKTINVTVKLSSSSLLGSWEYVIDYNSSVLSLVSGERSIAGYGNGTQYSVSYSYRFKAIASGSSNISVKSYGAFDWDEKPMGTSVSGTSVRVITQAELEASYSKDNNLASLGVEGFSITPEFNKDTLEYKATLNPDTTSINITASASDRSASIAGAGTHEVTEGDNKFEIVVTAENGSTKTYTLIATVQDPDPIKVKTTDGKELTVVKRASSVTIPDNYEQSTVKINDKEVPSFVNKLNKLVLVALKDDKGNISLYVYNENDKTYVKYVEVKMNNLLLYPLNVEDAEKFGYKKEKIKINDNEISCYKYNSSSSFAIILAKDLETGEDGYYMYDQKNNSAILYNGEYVDNLNKKIDTYKLIIIGLLAETVLIFFILIIILINKIKRNKRRRKLSEKLKEEITEEVKEENKEIDKEKESEVIEEEKENKNKKKEKKKKNKKELEGTSEIKL